VKLPIAWLRDYLDIEENSQALAERLAALGFPVDEIVRRPQLRGVTIGRLTRIDKHPDADRLVVCTVDSGGPRPLTIATAATNVATGDVVPVATIGAQLAGLEIGPRRMRGIDSEGMLCSAAELGLEAAWFDDGILQLEKQLVPGTDFVAAYRLNDDVLDVEITANRVDAMSVVGLARELAASLGRPVREPDLGPAASPHADPAALPLVTIESPDCKRFVAQRFSIKKDAERAGNAPFWMRVRLALAGQRPIDHLVDISNFVMLETAQPLHFYDFERLAGGRLIVRDARDGEPMRTLDEADRTLDSRFLVIADEREPQCIAGLKGGADSEVTAETRELLVEAAAFSGPRVRRMSVALGLRTEASSRHEKGLPLGLASWGAARAAHLLAGAGATAHAPFVAGASDATAAPIVVPVARFGALLGVDVSEREAEEALVRLGFHVSTSHADEQLGEAPFHGLAVTPPRWRGDVRIPEDVVEEVARITGYDRIEPVLPPVLAQNVSSAAYRTEMRVAHALAALGYREAVTFSMQPGGIAQTCAKAGLPLETVLEILNPLSEDQRYLRFSLLPALLQLAARHGGAEPYRIFEVGHVFAGGDVPAETAGVAWLLALPKAEEPPWRDSGFLTFKGESQALLRGLAGRDAEAVPAALPGWHPGKTAELRVDETGAATIGAIDPRLLAAFEVEARVYAGWMTLATLPAYHVPRYAAPSRYPPVARDLALIVAPDVAATEIERAVRASGNGAIADVRVFDEYRGPQIEDGKKSIAVRVVLQRSDATLTDADADAHIAAVRAALGERFGAKIRE